MNRIFRATAALAALAALAGCAQDIGTIDRVQNNLVLKADLLFNQDGSRKEWFYRSTTIEAPYASAYSFVGDQAKLDRGVFEIQEKALFFYRTYTFTDGEYNQNPRKDVDQTLKCEGPRSYCDAAGERLDPAVPCDCEGNYLVGGKPLWMDKNAALLAFPITKHTDVIWEYNPNTGEKTNVRVENDTDRLWPDRDYIRVTWGANQVLNLENHFQNFTQPGGTAPTLFRDESAAPDAEPRLTPELGYMDFTDDLLLGAKTVDDPDYGTIPLCWFYAWYSGGVYECTSERVKVRQSFLQIDPAREAEFEPLQFDDFDMERFGYFRAERLTWDKNYGTTYSASRRYAMRHDIWKKDAAGAVVGVKPVVYTMNESYPRDLVEEANALAVQWSKGFDATVKGVTGQDPAAFDVYSQAGRKLNVQVDHMFVVCENNWKDYCGRGDLPAAATDPELCNLGTVKFADGAEGVPADPCKCVPYRANLDGSVELLTPFGAEVDEGCLVEYNPKRTGDIRFSFLHAVFEPTQTGLLGFGPPSADPLSGRIVTGNAYNYVAAMREQAVRAVDYIELQTGVKSFREIANATYIAEEVRAERLTQATYWKKGYTEDEARAMVQKMVPEQQAAALTATLPQKTDQNFTASRLGMLAQHPDIESMFVNDDVKMLFKDPLLGDQGADLQAIQTQKYALRKWSHGGQKKLRDEIVHYGSKAMDYAKFFDTAILRQADEAKVRYDQAVCNGLNGAFGIDWGRFNETTPCTTEEVLKDLRAAFSYYNGSSPYGYNRTYIPTPLEMDTAHPGLQATQSAFKQILNDLRPVIAQEIYKQIFWGIAIHEVGHSIGLRHNFEASTDAMNFDPEGYWARKVKKEGDKYVPTQLWGYTTKELGYAREHQYSSVMDYYYAFNQPWHGVGRWDVAAIKYAYGSLMEVFKTEPKVDRFSAYLTVDPAADAPGNVPALKERGEGLGLLLRRIHHTEIPNLWDDVSQMFDREDVKRSDVLGARCDAEGASCGEGRTCKKFYDGLHCSIDRTVVPYRFGSDEMAWYLPTVNMWDDGADAFEMVDSLREIYENSWVFNGYWHQDPTFWPTSWDGTVRRIFYVMRSHFQWWVVGYQTYNHNDYWFKKFGKRWEEDLNGGLPGAMAAYMSFNTMASAFGRPIPGNYGFNWLTNRYEPLDDVNQQNYTTQLVLMEEDGARPIYANWDYNGYQPNVVSAGSIYDRIAAFEILSDPEMWVMGVDSDADTRKYMINYASVFRPQMMELFGGLIANNATKYGWCIMLHPTSGQPVGFAPRAFAGEAYAGQDCTNSYAGCFATNNQGVPTDLAQLLPLGTASADQCPAGTAFQPTLTGSALEPEPLYTFPTTRFRIPLLAAYYGMSLMTQNYDMAFLNATRIWLKGSKFSIALPPEVEADKENLLATCEDKFSGRIYQAYRMADEGYYPAFDLVKQCDFIFGCFDPTRNKDLSSADAKACKIYAFGNKTVDQLTLDDLRSDYLFHPLQFLIGKLELVRTMHASYEYASEQ